jgi:hypothetical protein
MSGVWFSIVWRHDEVLSLGRRGRGTARGDVTGRFTTTQCRSKIMVILRYRSLRIGAGTLAHIDKGQARPERSAPSDAPNPENQHPCTCTRIKHGGFCRQGMSTSPELNSLASSQGIRQGSSCAPPTAYVEPGNSLPI